MVVITRVENNHYFTDHEGDGIAMIWDKQELSVDVVMNGGVFLCMRAGLYHFSAALSSHANEKKVGVHIAHNSINGVYARYLNNRLIVHLHAIP